MGAAVLSFYYPSHEDLGPVARILDLFVPWLLGFAALFAGGVVLLGLRRLGLVLGVLIVAGAGVLGTAYRQITVPQTGAEPEIEVLFFNVRARNGRFGDQIVSEVLELDPDIAVFAEAEALLPFLDRLQEAYDFVSPCSEESCEILVATDLGVTRFWQLQLNPAWPARYRVMEFLRPEGGRAFLAASHLVKPWFSGIAEIEVAQLTGQLNWFEDGPVAVVGDFNMAPWSLPMRTLLQQTGFRAVRGQPGSWPARRTLFRVPIDQLLLQEVQATSIVPFGDDLNSNHRGFVAGLTF